MSADDGFWSQLPEPNRPGHKWETVGDCVTGVITDRRVLPPYDGDPDKPPVLVLDVLDDAGQTVCVIASQARLSNTLRIMRPNVGDGISITYTGMGKPSKPGAGAPKTFDVSVIRKR